LNMIASTVQIALGVIFIQAAVGKLRRWHEFKGMLHAYELLPLWSEAFFAVCLIGAELLTGVALVTSWKAAFASVIGAAMFLLFAGAMAVNIRRGRTSIDCGCFQSIRQPLEWRLVVRNVVCAVAALVSAGVAEVVEGVDRWAYAVPGALALFAIYLALNAVWALDESRRIAFRRA